MRETLPATLVDALGWATRRLSEGGVAGPRREALDLWSELSGMDRAVALINPDGPVQEGEWRRFKSAVDRRVGGEPLAYALGRVSFRTLELNVDRRVLIPRPETEGLVQAVLTRARQDGRTGPAADIGTGSGCIALSLAVEGDFSRVVATDVSTDALAVAADNVSLVRTGCPVELRHGDMYAAIRGETFDVIVSNPPYVSESEYPELDPGVRDFEPHDALVSSQEGMQHVRELLGAAGRHLNVGGFVAIEIADQRAEMTLEAARRLGWGNARVEPDVFGRRRYLLATRAAAA